MENLFTILSSNRQFTRKKKFDKLNCNPKNISSKNKLIKSDSCLDGKTIILLKKIWNKRHPDMKIQARNKNVIWNKLKNYMSYSCSNEKCWIDQIINNSDKKQKLKNELFAPNAPNSWKNNITEWLSSLDIKNVMKQYEEKHNNFLFIGPSPIDFEVKYENSCVWPELCNFSVENYLKNNKTKIGFIFNTDPHYKSGSHWIALFLDLDKKKIFFFDSNGNEAPNEITDLIKKIVLQCNKLNIKLKIDSNVGFTHQKQNTECGMYCLYFIINILDNKKSLKYFKSKIIPDKSMIELRNKYFKIN